MTMWYMEAGGWKELPGGEDPDTSGLTDQQKVQLSLVGTHTELTAWREEGQDFTLHAWLDHWYRGTPIWGLVLFIGSATYVSGQPIYTAATADVHVIRGDEEMAVTSQDVDVPLYNTSHYWWPTPGGAAVKVAPVNVSMSVSAGPAYGFNGGSGTRIAAEYRWRAGMEPMAGGGVFRGIASKTFSLPSHLSSGADALRGELLDDVTYRRKPGVTVGQLIMT